MFSGIIGGIKSNPDHGLPAYRVYVLQGDTALNTSDFTTKDIHRFWSKVNISDDPDACWEWQAGISEKGYGKFHMGNTMCRAHRISYILNYGSIPDDLNVLHQCDNRKCVNPNHLFLGTQSDNIRDMQQKNRTVSGEKSPTAKLTSEQVIEIRKRYANGGISQKALAKEYGMGQATISLIISRKRWKQS